MKMPFDIKFRPQIESGEYKVETRDGKPTRIVCWNLKGNEDFFILALVEKNQKEVSYCYPATGCCKAACDPEGKDDLFIITPEPELSEFEHAFGLAIVDAPEPEEKEEWYPYIKEKAAELFDIAKSEIYSHESLVEYAKKAKAEGKAEALKEIEQDPESSYAFKRGVEYGKEEALKDLPRWRKCADCTPKPKYSNEWIFSIDSENVTRESAIVHKGYFLPLDGLEKLPGFNE